MPVSVSILLSFSLILFSTIIIIYIHPSSREMWTDVVCLSNFSMFSLYPSPWGPVALSLETFTKSNTASWRPQGTMKKEDGMTEAGGSPQNVPVCYWIRSETKHQILLHDHGKLHGMLPIRELNSRVSLKFESWWLEPWSNEVASRNQSHRAAEAEIIA